ncbi:putative 28S rRNA (cytosine(4447)-C(5))-methyltransferase [Portunus trituberculatus]|uniref:Putative 28S rRNA (Cytosine(4447)-C(5))-methyltransferase n=1 Tax=Portunus trituberculatus TaxID=210409 RepID=A0A5B7D357_PORTR|nr:putative 28S rRNA (cytosine(4447)-C(5))-methyltransferase [Portunus trituberculatus]
MGRAGNFQDKPKKGPGRKARKQKDPVFPSTTKVDDEPKKLSRRQKIRAKKRTLKQEAAKANPSKKMKKMNAKQKGDAYLEESAEKIGIQIPSLEEIQQEDEDSPDLPNINARIKDTAFVLADFSKRREEGRSRSEYLAIFLKDLSTYYSYNAFLMEKLLDMFGPTELIEFLEANELPRPTRRKVLATALIARGIDVDVITWSKVGLIVMRTPGNVTLGATPEYLAGQYILQGASSFLPVMALAPKEGEKILDMCAAPGGKSTHIEQQVIKARSFYPDEKRTLGSTMSLQSISLTWVSTSESSPLSSSAFSI